MTASSPHPSQSPFQQLLLATEHSEFDRGAERIALEIARRCQLTLHAVLPIASNPEFEAVAPQLAARAEAQAGLRLRELQDTAALAQVTLDCKVRRGPELDQEIVQEARVQGSDLIITRRRGKRGFFANLLVGEMVSRVVAHAPCSVLLVPRASGMWTQQVLLALDPQSPLALQMPQLQAAIGVAAECKVGLHVVCVMEHAHADRGAADALIASATALAAQRQVNLQASTPVGKPFEQIVATADQCGADLLVLGRHGDALPGRAWLGGTTQKVIGLAERPVLVAIAKESAKESTVLSNEH